jgi:malonyl-ACP O-methyltransferase BioC
MEIIESQSKKKVKAAFDGAACTYDLVAEVQTLSSMHLAQLTEALVTPQTILDIGCGTGVTTAMLQQEYPRASYTLCDISSNMIRVAQRRVKNAQFIVCDAEKYDFLENYNLGVANLVLQWFESYSIFLEKILEHCDYFAFSMLVDNSFGDWREKLKNYGVFSSYPSTAEMLHTCRKYGVLEKYEVKSYNVAFKTLLEAAQYFKKLGATTNFTSQSNVLSVLREHTGIILNYEVFFALLKKRDF